MSVDTEHARFVAKGYITKHDSWAALFVDYQGVIVSKLAATTKQRPDGSIRLRLIVDIRRSGLNDFVMLNEGILLSRVRDVVKDIMSLMVHTDCIEDEVELAVVDFVHAHQTTGVHPDERWHQVVAGDGSYFVMCSVAFGGAQAHHSYGVEQRPSWVN